MINELMRRRALLSASESLPYDAQVEWLSNGGTAFIDTGIIPKDTPRVVLKVAQMDNFDTDVFGFATNTVPSFVGDLSYHLTNNTQGFQYYRYYSTTGVGQVLVFPGIGLGTYAEWDLGYICKCNGQLLTTLTRQSFVNNSQTLYLFKGRTLCSQHARVAYFQVYDGDALMRDFIPVRVGQVGYMYDKVSKQLFGNAGSGAFIFGNDI